MPKIPGRRVDSSDCLIKVDGREYPVHLGEWVEVLGVKTIAQHLAIVALQQAAQADPSQMARALDALCTELADHVLDWSWTDLDSVSLPKPYHHPEVVKGLSEDELLYLVRAVTGESPGERKNA